MTVTCPVCEKGKLAPVDDIVSDIEGIIFVERGERCTSCGEEFIPAEESARTIRIARRLGIWGEPLRLRRKLSRSGRGVVLRIPADLQENLGWEGDEEVLISKVGKRLVIEAK
ncbi:MAG TPA: hypothetical protein VJ397_08515 [Thermoplasmata archaeon]|nr:hypothetical protein [Thermoplasmata archaeon]